MLKLSEEAILQRIAHCDLFECEVADGSFSLKIESYTPVICAAVHAGGQFRSELADACLLDESERRYEEDPYTDQLIQAMPITLIAKDSRYEYDLNRPVARCIYTQAWGKEVWNKKLTPKKREHSVKKHRCFYRVLDALVEKIEEKFGAAIVFDVHSYNFLRHDRETPTFNIGSEQIYKERWQPVVELALEKLAVIELPNIPVTAKENDVFFGRGYMISHINSRYEHTLVLPIEVKKVFMDELNGELYPLVMQSLSQQFKTCLVELGTFFTRRYTLQRRAKKVSLLADTMDPNILNVDKALYALAKGLETLYYINPINIPSERKHFFKCNGNYVPQFRYRQLNVDPYRFREKLYRLPVDSIRDPSIQSLYRDVIDSLSQKIDLLVKAGSAEFIYESLKYYGEPSAIDIKNAQFLLHANSFEKPVEHFVSTEELCVKMRDAAKRWGMRCKVETSNKLVASAMVSNSRRAVLLAKDLHIPLVDAEALVHHELGVHMATTLNAASQRLKVFSLGLPGNTMSQEGLAILNEFHSGNVTLKRMQGLALRVLAVRNMLEYGDFRQTFSFLKEEHKLSEEKAFALAVRVHRGGGFTKDYVYLNGVSSALELYKIRDIKNLYIGKTGFSYLPVIDEMVERQLVNAPIYYPAYLEQPIKASPVLDYVMSCIHASKRQSDYLYQPMVA